MVWRVEFSAGVEKSLKRLDPQEVRRILSFLHQRVALAENPRLVGQALKGSELGQFWKYRVGDYRVIADLQDSKVTVLVVRIGNRREVYR